MQNSVDLTNPSVLKFHTELVERQVRHTAKWFLKNKEKLALTAKFKEDDKGCREEDIIKLQQERLMKVVTQVQKDTFQFRRKKRIEGIVLGIDKLSIRPKNRDPRIASFMDDCETMKRDDEGPMRPANEGEKKILYGERPPNGRQPYLNLRYKAMPEMKYYYPECSYWDYGWCSSGSKIPPPSKEYCRLASVSGNVGKYNTRLARDPDHYFWHDSTEPNKCSP